MTCSWVNEGFQVDADASWSLSSVAKGSREGVGVSVCLGSGFWVQSSGGGRKAFTEHCSASREIGILLPNNQRQHRTLYPQEDVLPYALC